VQDDSERRTRANFARNGGFMLTVLGASHFNFSDYPILVPWRRFTNAGPVNPSHAGTIIRYWTVGFFDMALRNRAFPPATPGADVRLESWPPPNHDPARRDEDAHASSAAAPR
jgi:hypothetical protein